MPYKRHTRFLSVNKVNSQIFHIIGKKMQHKFLLSAILVLLVFGLYTPIIRSQDDGSNPTCTWTLTNDQQTDATHYQLDVYLLRTGPHPFVLFNCQVGLKYTKGINGTLTAAWIDGSSEFLAGNLPFSAPAVTSTAIQAGIDPQVTEANSTIISDGTSGNPLGTKVGTLVITSPTPFVAAPLGVTYATSGLLTKAFAFVGGFGVDMNALGLQTKNNNLTNPVLPVELSSFLSNVNGREVNLNWETKTEVNTRQLEIDRTLVNTTGSSTTWSSVGSLTAAGTSTTPKKYSYTDKNLQSGKYQYRLKMVDNDGSFNYSSVEAAEVAIPKDFAVSQNYPNPFNPSTKIDYQVPVDAKVILEVYNITGQKVVELVNQEQSAGYYTVDFGASKLSSGVYIYRLAASDKATGNNFSSIKKMILLK